jgi:tetratricopeptide (TPR) repeat protein
MERSRTRGRSSIVAVAKKKKKKAVEESTGARLDEIQSRGDDLSEWISNNPLPILGGVFAILAVTGIYVLAMSGLDGSRNAASAEIAAVKNDFRVAMGGAYSGSLVIPEPANPETARNTREEYIGRFRELAAAHEGTEMGGYALFQIASLQSELDDDEAALATYQQALESYDEDAAMRGIILERVALLHEASGDLAGATASHLAASEIGDYPLRYFALLNAARTQAEAGQDDLAVVNFDRVTLESPDLLIPEHTQALLSELKAKRSL